MNDLGHAGTTSTADLANRYDDVPYAAVPHPQTHPDRLASVATFLGRVPPAVDQCSVLEVGCNDGANLIPMAVSMPDARLVGCDLSRRAIDAGRRVIDELRLPNITLLVEDLAALSPDLGSFDYIIAHGVYSWVPPHVRDALFALAEARLAPKGVMFVSFNVLPGCRIRQAVWDVLRTHVAGIDEPGAKLRAAREIARLIGEGTSLHDADDAIRAEFRAIADRSDSALFHDDLATYNDAFQFHEFAAHAARHGLTYVAEAELNTMSAVSITPQARSMLTKLDPIAREQYLDFVRMRRFRQSLLCRAGTPPDMTMHPRRVRGMYASADPSLLRAAAAGNVAALAQGLDPERNGGGPVRALLDALVAHSPAATPIAALVEDAGLAGLSRPLEAILTDAFVSGIVTLHTRPPPLVRVAGERPIASPLARLQARSRDEVTSLVHTRIRLPDANARRLISLLDGTRDRTELAAAVDGPAFNHDRATARAFVDHALEQYGRLALLVA